jgi:pyruvate,water dikinase
MAEFLVELGIDSISLNPDTVLKTTERILDVERRLGRDARRSDAERKPAVAIS